MSGTTAGGWPFVVSTDEPRTFPTLSLALANKLEAMPTGGGSGSTILSGTATPTTGDGAVGDYYLDTDDHILYGPRTAGGYLTGQTLFAAQTPPTSWGNTNWSMGADLTFAMAGRVTSLRYWRYSTTNAAVTSSTLKVWSSGGALLATATTTAESGSGWRTATLGAPLSVTAGQTVRVSVDLHASLTQEVGCGSGLVPLVNGDLSNGTGQGWYKSGGAGYPNISNPQTFWIDAMLEASAAVWPVALRSVPPGGTTGQYLKKTSNADYAVAWVT